MPKIATAPTVTGHNHLFLFSSISQRKGRRQAAAGYYTLLRSYLMPLNFAFDFAAIALMPSRLRCSAS